MSLSPNENKFQMPPPTWQDGEETTSLAHLLYRPTQKEKNKTHGP